MKPEQKAVQLTEDEKMVLSLLKANYPMDLNELKSQTGLSNKKWDKAIKGLTKTSLPRWRRPMQAYLFHWFKVLSISKIVMCKPQSSGWGSFFVTWIIWMITTG